MREHQKRAMIVKSSRIRFLASWAEKLINQHSVDEIKHAVKVFAQNRFRISDKTARQYARETIRFLGLPEEESSKTRIIRVRLDESEYRILKKTSEERKTNISAIVRQAVRKHIKEE